MRFDVIDIPKISIAGRKVAEAVKTKKLMIARAPEASVVRRTLLPAESIAHETAHIKHDLSIPFGSVRNAR
jgi:hypothetical protein